MRRPFTRERAAKVSPDAYRQILAAHGWAHDGGPNSNVTRYTRRGQSVYLSLWQDRRDYGRRAVEMLTTLAETAHVSPASLLDDVEAHGGAR